MHPEALGESASEKMLAHIFRVMRENEKFLHNRAEGIYDAVMRLVNDAIDHVGFASKRMKDSKQHAERSMVFFVHHILMPFSYALYVDLIAGNAPACFMELRLMLEAMAECYLADFTYRELSFFHDRLESLEKEKLRAWRIVSQAGKRLGHEDRYLSLWGKLSEDWLHPKGIADKVINYLVETSDMPAWSLIVPMNYVQEDLVGLDELSARVSQFRDLLKTTMENYWQEIP